jgi:antitoxin component HigA of HigAB toxin-antitoxin module
MGINKGRKSTESNMALEHLQDLVEQDIENGTLEGQGAELMRNYLMHLQPKTGLQEDKEYQWRKPPGRLV